MEKPKLFMPKDLFKKYTRNFEEIEELMKSEAVDWEKLDRYLRGYK